MGNISTYTAGGETVTYTYDAQGQLLKAVGDKTYTYTYDAAGNILTASDGTVSHSYTYGNTNWRDLLTAFDGESIAYDAIGNPTSYYNGTRWTFSWSNGRQLTSASNGTNSITYTYTADGIRTSKVVDGVTYNYYYASGKLLRQTWGDNVLDFFYDEAGRPYAFEWGGYYYYYITNLQGDVIAIMDAWGGIYGTYEYDPYGNILSCTGWAATFNPLRYRGYVYDTETGLYYLQSRYYDPSLGRFINADSYVSTGQGILGNNMFAYCRNNPVSRKDASGTDDVSCTTEEDNDPFNDLGKAPGQGSGGGAGGGSTYGVSFATSQYSSLYTGGFYNTGYTSYVYSPSPHTSSTSSTSPSSTVAACFVAGTLVQREDGAVPIEDIAVGDKVWAWDEETGEVALREVVETYINETSELVHVFVNGEEIITTPTHPFYSPVRGWTDAVHLRAGDILILVNGEYAVVEKVQHEILEAPITVYNFQVGGYHTYYVSKAGVLVHNRCQPANKSPEGSDRSGAFNQAKRDMGIPVSQQPDAVLPNYDRRGNIAPGRVYQFGHIQIRDDSFGHSFSDGSYLPPHFNTPDGGHYFYG